MRNTQTAAKFEHENITGSTERLQNGVANMIFRMCFISTAILLAAPPVAQMRGVPPRTLTEVDADAETTVRSGSSIVIKLPSNISTGHVWTVMKATNASATEFAMPAPPSTTVPSGPPVIGAPGTTTFRVRFGKPGRASVVLGYMPPGSGRTPDEVLHYHFTVIPAFGEVKR